MPRPFRRERRTMYRAQKTAEKRRHATEFVEGSTWVALLIRYEHGCAYCRRQARLTVEHARPLSRGGVHTKRNLLPACARCNKAKGKKLLWSEWTPPNPHPRLLEAHPCPGH